MTRLLYRGVSYDNSRHQPLPATPVEHIYRGQHFSAPLRHQPAPVDPALALHYRGNDYHHPAAPQQP